MVLISSSCRQTGVPHAQCIEITQETVASTNAFGRSEQRFFPNFCVRIKTVLILKLRNIPICETFNFVVICFSFTNEGGHSSFQRAPPVPTFPLQLPQTSKHHHSVARMRRCLRDSCTRVPSFNIDGSKPAVYCRKHAEDDMVDVRIKSCLRISCRRRPTFNVDGSKTAVYCKEHAEEGMVNVRDKRCAHDSCSRVPSFNVEGSKKAAYCKQHAEDGMVDVRSKRCSHESCTKRPTFNVKGVKMAVCCKQHAEDGMVNVRAKCCAYDSCTKRPNFNFSTDSRKTGVYCRQHAEDGMVDVHNRSCSHDSCKRRPNFNVESSKTAIYCRQHADEGMVDVLSKRCSHASCSKPPTWGIATDGTATVCASHKNDLFDGLVIRFKAICKVPGCGKVARWGLDGKQPTHCHDHGPLQEGLVDTVGMYRIKAGFSSSSSRAPRGPSHDFNTECSF